MCVCTRLSSRMAKMQIVGMLENCICSKACVRLIELDCLVFGSGMIKEQRKV